ncbi:MAG TPA: hypothetical protein ENI62_01845 [Gammaproteobacteria bacterium]|nr:hypothetical protein [Gammaproteobacteria bacterium]
MKIFIATLLILASLQARSEDVYVDPDCATNGNGSTQNCSDGANGPRNSWVGITYVPGNAYLGKGGATASYDSCNFLIKADGTDAFNQITLGSFGTGQHSIVCASGYVFGETQHSWITIDNLDLTATTGQCLFLQGSNNITVKNVTFRNCGVFGIGLGGNSVSLDHDNLTIAQNTFLRTGGSAISGKPALANTQEWANIRITGNTFQSGVGSGSDPYAVPAISLVQVSDRGAGVQNTISNLEIDNNTFLGVNYTQEFPSFLILLSRTPFPANPGRSADHSNCVRQYSIYGTYIHDNTATNIGGGIGVHFSVGSRITGNRLTNFRATTVIGLFYSEHMYTGENVIDEIATGAFAKYWDGLGIDYDYCTRNGIIAHNHISNARGSDVANEDWNGQGIAVFAADTHWIYSNVLVNNRFGVLFGNDILTKNYRPNHVFNNTIINSLRDGISTRITTTQENLIYNNIIAFSQRYGLRADGRTEQQLSNNLFFGNAVSDIVSNETGTGTVNQDPGLIGGNTVNAFRILTGSPAYRSGIPVSELYTDFDGQARPVPPSIGAFEPVL